MRKILLALCLLLPVGVSATITPSKLSTTFSSHSPSTDCGTTGLAACWASGAFTNTSGAFLGAIVVWANTTETIQTSPALACTDAAASSDTMTLATNTTPNSSGNFRATDTNGGGTDMCYVLATGSARTTFFIGSTTSSAPSAMTIYQFTYTSSPITAEGLNSADRTSSSTTITGLAPTITGSSEIVFIAAACGSSCSAVSQSYTGDFTANDGTAYKVTTSTTAANWTQSPSSTGAVSIISFKEAGGTTPSCTLLLTGVGSC